MRSLGFAFLSYVSFFVVEKVTHSPLPKNIQPSPLKRDFGLA